MGTLSGPLVGSAVVVLLESVCGLAVKFMCCASNDVSMAVNNFIASALWFSRST